MSLAITYCDELVEDATLRAVMFPDVDFDSTPSQNFAAGDYRNVTDPLIARISAFEFSTQVSESELRDELTSLSIRLGSDDSVARTATLAKANCAALAGSAALTMY